MTLKFRVAALGVTAAAVGLQYWKLMLLAVVVPQAPELMSDVVMGAVLPPMTCGVCRKLPLL